MLSKQAVKSREILSKQAVKSKEMLSKQADKIAKQAEEHERFINKVPFLHLAYKLTLSFQILSCALAFGFAMYKSFMVVVYKPTILLV